MFVWFTIIVGIILSSLTIPFVSAAPQLVRDPLLVEYDITVYVDPVAQTIKGRSVIITKSPNELTLLLGQRFKVTHAFIDGKILKPSSEPHGMMHAWKISNSQRNIQRYIEIHWHGKLASLNTSLNHQETLGKVDPVSGSLGTFLPDSSGWYPRIAGELASYRVSIEMPPGQRGLVAGRIL